MMQTQWILRISLGISLVICLCTGEASPVWAAEELTSSYLPLDTRKTENHWWVTPSLTHPTSDCKTENHWWVTPSLTHSTSDYSRLSTTDPVTAARELSVRGFLKAERGDHRGAIADYTRALQLDPANPDLYYNRGISRAAIGDHRGAIADYSEVIRRDPGSGDAYYNRGLTHLVSQNQQSAIADFTQAIQIYEVRAAMLTLMGETPTLIPDANLPYVYYNRGKVLLGLDFSLQGITDLQRAVLLAEQTGDRTLAQIIRAELSGNP